MTIDKFETAAQSVSAPAASCFSITPSDTDNLAEATKALYVGVGGTVTLRAAASMLDVTFVGVPSGSILPVRVYAVRATGTTASDIIGLA